MDTIAFDDAFAHTVGLEGRYSNNLSDAGGETMYGITISVARQNGYTGAMVDMPLDTAKVIYQKVYWGAVGLDRVASLSPSIAKKLFDIGVNMGPGRAGTYLQMSLNALNQGGTQYPDMAEDGQIGDGTISALSAYLSRRGNAGVDVLLKAVNCLQGAQYINLSRMHSADETFVYGWLANRID